ncbi:tryptophan synthase subunit alpha [Actinokineospora diospyrosa]|uniref:Tryptophan synthase alpha chain n=1 Tax=Actinokineospora diospyrosa TaxID=103728 RepID=A0ABT1I525_9PSEU|nr:tryptophan synthase subunit alpha [Actinokineospora diospyrosa]MCP2267705.1 tryptophan synthase, alpha chain [Actinokineospora diospyrosa]
MTTLEASLRAVGHPVLMPYVTGGVTENWLDYVHAAVDAGADAVEIGIPFSDPVIDGPVIQAASVQALERGTTPDTVMRDLAAYRGSVPLVVMTYYNLVHRYGHAAFARRLVEAGVSGVVLADLPMEEAAEWTEVADAAGIATVLLAAPSTPDSRLEEVCTRSQGFVYAMGVMGVTGERAVLADSARDIADRVKAVADKPVLVGVGVSTPENAALLSAHADGVIIGAPVMRRIAEGGSVADLVAGFRAALG